MAPPPPNRPSAVDGYRRLTARPHEAAPTLVPEDTPDVAIDAPLPHRGRWRRRSVGAVRLLGLFTMLAIIIGTSVNLASADTADTAAATKPATEAAVQAPKQAATPATPAPTRPSARDTARDTAAVEDTTTATTTASTASEAATDVPAAAAAATDATTSSTASLPLTGDPQLRFALLFGALLVLGGMCAQIAGQRPSVRRAAQLRSR